ncbi:MAG: hypothetical protein ACXVFU_15340, partial [Nocardioidaceae bacterium]
MAWFSRRPRPAGAARGRHARPEGPATVPQASWPTSGSAPRPAPAAPLPLTGAPALPVRPLPAPERATGPVRPHGVVRLAYADGSAVTLQPDDPRARAFRAIARELAR